MEAMNCGEMTRDGWLCNIGSGVAGGIWGGVLGIACPVAGIVVGIGWGIVTAWACDKVNDAALAKE